MHDLPNAAKERFTVVKAYIQSSKIQPKTPESLRPNLKTLELQSASSSSSQPSTSRPPGKTLRQRCQEGESGELGVHGFYHMYTKEQTSIGRSMICICEDVPVLNLRSYRGPENSQRTIRVGFEDFGMEGEAYTWAEKLSSKGQGKGCNWFSGCSIKSAFKYWLAGSISGRRSLRNSGREEEDPPPPVVAEIVPVVVPVVVMVVVVVVLEVGNEYTIPFASFG